MFRREEEEGIAIMVNEVVPATHSSTCRETPSFSDPALACTIHQKDTAHSGPSTGIISNEVSVKLKNQLSKVPANNEASIIFMDTGHQKVLHDAHR